MIQKVFKNSRSHVLLLAALMLSGFVLIGCGSGGGGGGTDSYDAPATTKTASSLIQAETLKGWMDSGLVNSTGYDNVVILDIQTSAAAATTAHIPGAYRVDITELKTERFEGVAYTNAMVATGSMMDSIISRTGIDENTTIVFSNSANQFWSIRAYWTFRYWGFPVERLKFLDGVNTAWVAAATDNAWGADYALTATVPAPADSGFCVADNGAIDPTVRAHMGEVLTHVIAGDNGDSVLTIDARGQGTFDGTSTSWAYYDAFNKTVFEGHPEGGTFLGQGALFDPATGKFLPASDLIDLFVAAGWDNTQSVYTYCLSGWSATPIWFALDVILGADAQLYDGSWSQWGQSASHTTADIGSWAKIADVWTFVADGADGFDDVTGARLPEGSAWATNAVSFSGLGDTADVVYHGLKATVTPVSIDAAEAALGTLGIQALDYEATEDHILTGPEDPFANQIETEDSDYMSGGSGSAPTEGSGGGGLC